MICWLALALATTAAPAEAMEQAKRYFDAGNDAYNAGQYLPAARAYEAALEHAPLSAIRFTLAQAYRRQYYVDRNLEWVEKARSLYEQYLAEEPSGRRREDAVSHLATIDTILLTRKSAPREVAPQAPSPSTELMIWSKTRGARASLDGGPWLDLPFTSSATTGAHLIRAESSGYAPVELDAVVIAGRISVVEVRLVRKRASIVVDGEGSIAIDGVFVGDGPQRLIREPGPHTVEIFRRGYDLYTKTTSIAAGGVWTVAPELTPSVSGRARTVLFWGAGLVAAAGLGTGVGALARQSEAISIAEAAVGESRNLDPEEASSYSAAARSRDALRTTSIALISSAALLAGIGIALHVLDQPSFDGQVSF